MGGGEVDIEEPQLNFSRLSCVTDQKAATTKQVLALLGLANCQWKAVRVTCLVPEYMQATIELKSNFPIARACCDNLINYQFQPHKICALRILTNLPSCN
jgi:hypothetical protein